MRAAIEGVCGGRVVEARTQPGGFSPGLAARDLPIPRLRGMVDRPPWMALVLDDVAGRQPALPWLAAELKQVVAVLDHLADALTPAPVVVPTVGERLGGEFTGWRTLAAATNPGRLDPWSREHLDRLADLETTWVEHAAGDSLLHADIRADNLLLADRGPVVVDWPWACRGAAVVDFVLFAPSVVMQGGPPPAELTAWSRCCRAVGRETLAALVCGAAGYVTEQSLRPPPPGLPTVRAFQAAQGIAARRWPAELI